jgi:hypothetical protein
MDYKDQYNWNRVEWMYQLARAERLDAVAVRVGLIFATFMVAEDRETVSPSYEWVMSQARIKSRTTLSKALSTLEREGFLIIDRMHRYRNRYELPFTGDAGWNRCVQNMDT